MKKLFILLLFSLNLFSESSPFVSCCNMVSRPYVVKNITKRDMYLVAGTALAIYVSSKLYSAFDAYREQCKLNAEYDAKVSRQLPLSNHERAKKYPSFVYTPRDRSGEWTFFGWRP